MALTSSQVLDQIGNLFVRAISLFLEVTIKCWTRDGIYFLAAESEDMNVLISKSVIADIEGTKVTNTSILINIRWVYAVRTD